jgi:hypothetical protein
MNYSLRFKVDGINIKDLKPGIYNTFYYKIDKKKILIDKDKGKIHVLKTEKSVIISNGSGFMINKYHFHLDGTLFMKIDGGHIIKYEYKNNQLYQIENSPNITYSIIRDYINNPEMIYRKIINPILESSVVLNTYYFNNMKINVFELDNARIEEVQKRKFNIIWNPKDLDLYIPRIIIKEFLHIYFLMKNILGNKLNNKDLRQYIFRFLFDL